MHDVPGPAGVPDETVDPAGMSVLDVDGAEFGLGGRVAREFIEGGQRYWTTARRSAKAKRQLRHWKTKRWIKSRLNFDFPDGDAAPRARTDVGVENVDVDVPDVELDAVDVPETDGVSAFISVALDSSRDLSARKTALRNLGMSNIDNPSAENEEVFRQIALHDDSPELVAEAIGWLSEDPDAQVAAFSRELMLSSDALTPALVENIPPDRMGELYDPALPADVRETIAQYATDQDELYRIAVNPYESDVIASLAINRITDQELLAKIADHGFYLDPSRITDPQILKNIFLSPRSVARTKRAVLGRITDQEFLEELLSDDSMAEYHLSALRNYKGQELLPNLVLAGKSHAVRFEALKKMKDVDENFLKEIVQTLNDVSPATGEALRRIVDQEFLADFIRSSWDRNLAKIALGGISSEKILQELLTGPDIKSLIELDILRKIKDQGFLKARFLESYQNYREDSSPEYNKNMMFAAVESLTDQDFIRDFIRLALPDDIQDTLLTKLQSIGDLDQPRAMRVARISRSKDVIREALQHTSPSVRASALMNDRTDELMVEEFLQKETDPRVIELAQALYPQDTEIDPDTGALRAPGARLRFTFTPDQIVAGVQALMPQEGALQRAPSITTQPMILAKLIKDYFAAEVPETMKNVGGTAIPTESLAKGLVAERLSDALKDIPLEEIIALVDKVRHEPADMYFSKFLEPVNEPYILDQIAGLNDETMLNWLDRAQVGPTMKLADSLSMTNGRTYLITDRSSGAIQAVSFAEGQQPLVAGAGPLSVALIGTPEAETMIRDNLSAMMINWWANSSNDQHEGSLAVQEAARRVLNPDSTDLADWPMDSFLRASIDEISVEHGHILDRFVAAQHNNTQRLLAALGLPSVTLFRGVRDGGFDGPNTSLFLRRGVDGSSLSEEPIMAEDVAELRLRPASAWAWAPDIAAGFAGTEEDNYLFAGEFPAHMIIATPLTGCGCFKEKEFVMAGNQEPVAVFRTSMLTYTETVLDTLVPGNPGNLVANPDNNDGNADWIVSLLAADEARDQRIGEILTELDVTQGTTEPFVPRYFETQQPGGLMRELLAYEKMRGSPALIDRFASLPPNMRKQFSQEFIQRAGLAYDITTLRDISLLALRKAVKNASPAELKLYNETVRAVTAARAERTAEKFDPADLGLDAVDIGSMDDLDAVDTGGPPKAPVFGPEVLQFPYEVRHGTADERVQAIRSSNDEHMMKWLASNDQSWQVRREAVSRISDQETLEWFAFTGGYPENKIAAGRITDQERLARIIETDDSDVSYEVKDQAVSQLHDQQVIQRLLEGPDLPMARKLLERVGNREFLERYIDDEKHSESLRRAAVDQLGRRRDPESVKALERLLVESPSKYVREAALAYVDNQDVLEKVARNESYSYLRDDAIAKLTDQSTLTAIAEQSPDWRSRRAALQKILDRDVLLRIAANDFSPEVQLVAVQKVLRPGAFGWTPHRDLEPLTEEQQRKLLDIAVNSDDDRLWGAVLDLVNDETLLVDVVLSPDASRRLQLKALTRIKDKDWLDVVLSESDDDEVRQLALRRSTPAPPRGSSWDEMGYEPVRLGSALEEQSEQMLTDLYQRYLSNDSDDLTEQEFREGIVEAIRNRLLGTPMVAFSERSLASILLQGAVKTQFETGTSNGLLDSGMRNVVERDRLGVPEWIDPSLRPVYGSLEQDTDYPLTGGAYGGMYVFLHDAAWQRATGTAVDSLDHNVVGLPLSQVYTAPDAALVAAAGEVGLDAAYSDLQGDDSYTDMYAEVQIHGGLPLSDVKELWFELSQVTDGYRSNEYSDRIQNGEARAVMIEILQRFGFDLYDPKLFDSVPGFSEMLTATTAKLQDGDTDLSEALQELLENMVRALGYDFEISISGMW